MNQIRDGKLKLTRRSGAASDEDIIFDSINNAVGNPVHEKVKTELKAISPLLTMCMDLAIITNIAVENDLIYNSGEIEANFQLPRVISRTAVKYQEDGRFLSAYFPPSNSVQDVF